MVCVCVSVSDCVCVCVCVCVCEACDKNSCGVLLKGNGLFHFLPLVRTFGFISPPLTLASTGTLINKPSLIVLIQMMTSQLIKSKYSCMKEMERILNI